MSKLFMIAAALVFSFATQASAQSLGIDFKSMPKGTKVYYADSDGDKWMMEFKGRKGRGYRTNIYIGKKYTRLLSTEHYDQQGRWVNLIEYGGAYDYEITRTPYHCIYQLGKCSYVVNKISTSSGRYYANMIKKPGVKNTYIYTSRKKKDAEPYVRTLLLGKYNLRMRIDGRGSHRKAWTKITKIVVPK